MKIYSNFPKAFRYLDSKLVIDRYEIHDLDQNMAINFVELNKTFEEFNKNCLTFNKSKNLKFKLIYSPEERITGLRINFKDMLTRKKYYNNELIADLFINPYRNCIIGKNNFRNCFAIEIIEVGVKPILYTQTLLNWFCSMINIFLRDLKSSYLILFFLLIESEGFYYYDKSNYPIFTCELKYPDYYMNETDIPKSLEFTFKSEKEFELRICSIYVYQFHNDCGIPDKPSHSTFEITNKTVKYYPNSGYRLIGDNTINCLFEGNWDKEPPLFEPIFQCNTSDIDLKSKIYKKIELKDSELFNGTEVAVNNSKIVFQCDFGNKTSKTLVSVCDENGFWIRDDYKCK